MTVQLAACYEGTEPFPDAGGPPRTVAGAVRVAVTLAIVIVPFAGLGVAVWLAWGHGLRLADVLLATALYVVTGLGVTIGFHRLLTHRSFTAAPPFTTRRYDRATNLWPLALLSLGESWHNMHHSDPACARHGADPRQVDISATVIRIFERLGWATGVHWPAPARLDSHRRDQHICEAQAVAPGGTGTSGQRSANLAATLFDCERCSLYGEQCSSELNSVHLSGVLPGRRAQGPARCKGEPMTTTTPMTSWELFEDLRAAQDEMMRASRGRGWWLGQHHHASGTAAWAPAVDISERKDAYLVRAELPGVKASEVEITVEDGLLTIQGERHFARDSAEEKMHRTERFYGAFRRSITLPSHVEADKIEASAQDGVLQIMVPKASEVQAKRIQVRVGRGHTALKPGAAAKNGS